MASKSKAEVALREARELLAEAKFSVREPLLLDGRHVTVSATAKPAAELGYLEVRVSVFLPGHILVEWENLAIFIPGVEWPAYFNSDGKLRIRVPATDPESELTLMASPCVGEVHAEENDRVFTKQRYKGSDVESLITPGVTKFRESFDGVIAEGEIDPANYISVSFVTDDPRISKGRVCIQFLSADTRADTFLSKEAPPFEPAGQVWKTSFETPIRLPATAVMRFAVRPAEKKKEG